MLRPDPTPPSMPFSSPRSNHRVAHLPYYQSNLYQIELGKRLADHSFELIPCSFLDRRFGYDSILHIHWLPACGFDSFRRKRLSNLFAHLRHAGKKNIPVVWTVHNLYPHESTFRILDRMITNYVARKVRFINVHSKSAQNRVLAEFPKIDRRKTRITYHPNYIGCYPKHSRGPSRKDLGIPDSHLCLLFFGNIRRYKGVENLVESFRTLGIPEVTLLIAGKPRAKDDERYLHDKVKAMPNTIVRTEFVPDNQLGKYFAAADVCTLPYKDILTSGAALLYMSHAKACIAPKIEPFHEILSDKGTLFYDPNDPDGLKEAIRRAASLKNELTEMGRHQLDQARSYSWESFSNEIATLYRECLKT